MTEHLSDKVERLQRTEGDLVAGEDVLFDHFQVNYFVDETYKQIEHRLDQLNDLDCLLVQLHLQNHIDEHEGCAKRRPELMSHH